MGKIAAMGKVFKESINVKTKLAWNPMENGNFSHYFHSAKVQVIDIRLEIKVNEKVTKKKPTQSLINDVNIYFTIKATVS